MAGEEEKVEQLQAIAGISEESARAYLQAFNWDIEQAAQYVTSDDVEGVSAPEQAPEEPAYTGPRTLDGRPAPESSSSQSQRASSRPQQKKKGIATLASLGGNQAPASDDDDEDEDEEEDKKDRGDLFAGGEKSGLAVKDPNRKGEKKEGSRGIVSDIIAKARENARRGGSSSEEPEQPRPSRSWGAGQTVGGEGAESRAIPDPRGQPPAPPPAPGQAQERTIHLWQDGFSIDDGPLHRFDDPANQEALRLIRSGRAPLDLMNVRLDQPVDARIFPHDEPWKQLPRVYRPFGGAGRRLGSPVPGDGGAVSAPPTQAAAPTSAVSTSSASGPGTGADMTQPTLMLRVQMPDGARLPARFNTTQTVGDIYDFVSHANPATQSRAFVVATTFPNKDHTDRELVLGDMAEFKKGGTAVVKWA